MPRARPPAEPVSLRSLVAAFLAADGWPVIWQEDGSLDVVYEGHHGLWRCHGLVREVEAQFLFSSVAPLTVTRRRTRAVGEYLHRANEGMVLGNFELSWDRGEVRYKTSVDVEGGALTETMLHNLVYTNVRTMDQYLPGLKEVAHGEAQPADAVARAEA